MIKDELPEKLRELRRRKGLTSIEVGEILKKSDRTISAWECGRSQPDLDTLQALFDLYEEDPGILFKTENKLTLTRDEKDLIEKYREAPAEIRLSINTILGYGFEKKEESLSSAG